MVTKCVVPNCGNSCNTKLSVTLFSFPKDPQLAQKWLHATRARWVKQIKSHHKVCSKHFEKHLILDNFGATRLEPGSVPTIFEWNRKPVVKTDVSPLVNRSSNPFLTVEEVSDLQLNSYRRLILPKPAPGQPTPKVKLPPQIKRVAVVAPETKTTLGCDVILRDERISARQKLPRPRISPMRELSSSRFERIDSKMSNLQVSDDDSNGPIHVGHHIEEYENADCPLIEVDVPLHNEIDDPLSTGDGLLDTSDTMAGEVIIEECSIIEDGIIPSHQVHEPVVSLLQKDYKAVNASDNNATIDETDPMNARITSQDEKAAPKETDCMDVQLTLEGASKTLSPTVPNQECISEENPDLNDLSSQDIASIKKSLCSSQSSRVVILKKGENPIKADKPFTTESPFKTFSKMKPILPKVQSSSSPANSAVSTVSNPVEVKSPIKGISERLNVCGNSNHTPRVVTLSRNNVLTKVNASGSPAYFIPQGSPLTPSLASALLLQNSQNQAKQAQSVPASQSFANFLITTPATSTLVSNRNASSPQVVSPVVYQLGNVVPISGPLLQKPTQTSTNSNNAKRLPMKRTAAVTASKTKKQRKLGQDGDDPLVPTQCQARSSSEVEQRLLKQVESLKTALRRKTSTIKELKKDKVRLSKKLKLLGKAFGKLRKTSMMNLATAKCLEDANVLEEAPNMILDIKDLGKDSTLGDVVRTINCLSMRLHEQVKSKLATDGGKPDVSNETCNMVVKVEPGW